MDGTAADVMPVFGQVGQMAEVGEGADNADGPVTWQASEQLLEFDVGFGVRIASESDRELPDAFDQLKFRCARLFPYYIAQKTPQQADVFRQRAFRVAACSF